MRYELKRIVPSGIPAALEKADNYRELNQPAEAESICRDVLAVEPGHQLALRILGLALTDQFGASTGARYAEAERVFRSLRDPYERIFYTGLTFERQGRAQQAGGVPPYAVRPLFEQALACYDKAEALRPPGNDDAILRWNSCVRTLEATPHVPAAHAEHREDWEADVVPHQR